MIIKGIVRKSQGRGRRLGFPTANLEIGDAEIEDGLHVGLANKLPALIFVGAAETFGEKKRQLEAHILDFSADLYGQELEIEILEKLRESKKFSTAEALVEQMKADELAARKFFKL